MPLATSWSDVRISALFFTRRSALDSLHTTTREIHTLGAAGDLPAQRRSYTRRLVRSLAPESHEVNRLFDCTLHCTLVFDEAIFVLRAQTAPRLQFRCAGNGASIHRDVQVSDEDPECSWALTGEIVETRIAGPPCFEGRADAEHCFVDRAFDIGCECLR